MNKTLIASLLATACLTQSGCTIITHFVDKKKADEAAAAEAADQKALETAVAKTDLATLKQECKGTPETGGKRHWCQGYQEVFSANVGDMQCEAAWAEYSGDAKDVGWTRDMTTNMAVALADCDKWDVYFDEFLPTAGSLGVDPMDGRIEKAFLARMTAGTNTDNNVDHTVLQRMYGLQSAGKADGTCDEYLAAASTYGDDETFVRILVEKKCKGAVPVFEKGLLSDKMYVRASTCTGLAKVGSAKHIKPLENLAWTDRAEGSDYSMPVREACRDAYGKLETRLAM